MRTVFTRAFLKESPFLDSLHRIDADYPAPAARSVADCVVRERDCAGSMSVSTRNFRCA